MNRARSEGFTVESFAACLGGDTAVGAVRASLGIASNEHDIFRLLEVVESMSS
jgi:selenocysteine lyase/cysteine desulfurase